MASAQDEEVLGGDRDYRFVSPDLVVVRDLGRAHAGPLLFSVHLFSVHLFWVHRVDRQQGGPCPDRDSARHPFVALRQPRQFERGVVAAARVAVVAFWAAAALAVVARVAAPALISS